MSIVITIGTVKGCVFASNRAGVVLPFPNGLPGGIAIGAGCDEAVDKWLPFIKDSLKSTLLLSQDRFEAYVSAFMGYIEERKPLLPKFDVEVVLQGYGEKEMFPSEAHLPLGKGVDAVPSLELTVQSFHPYGTSSQAQVLGDDDDVDTLIHGISEENVEDYTDVFARKARIMKKRLVTAAEETGNPEVIKVAKQIHVADYVSSYKESLVDMVKDHFLKPFDIAVESFNMDDLIETAERLVDLAGMLKHFREGDEGCALTREIAIVTRAEGLVWIKRA